MKSTTRIMIDLRKKIAIRSLIWMPMMVILLMLCGCLAVGPNYAPPETSEPAAWHSQLQKGTTSQELIPQTLGNWWTTLNDLTLSSLVESSIEGNLDLKEAQARIREARARRGISRTDLFPSIRATGSGSVNKSSNEAAENTTNELYSTGFDASWELDLFGGKRRAVETATAELQAYEEDMRDVLVSLLAEVALNYIEVRSYQTRLSIAEANLNVQEETYDITNWRRQAGLTTQLDVEQAKYSLEQTRSQIPTLQSGLERAKNRLAVLLGQDPGSLNEILDERKAIPVAPLEVAVGVPADALRQRPDVRRAERELAAQTAQIGVAKAELFPKLSLSGSIGLEALALGNLFSSAAQILALGSNIAWTIFNAGSIRQSINVQTALQEQALIRYEAAILTALEEVENALTAYANEQARRESLLEATEAAQNAMTLARDQYSSGLIDFQVVLDTQRSLLSLQDELAINEGKVTSNLISLYKALGGGWTSLLPEGNI